MAEWQSTTQVADQYSVTEDAEARTGTRSGSRSFSEGTSLFGRVGLADVNYDKAQYSVVGINATQAKAAADRMVTSTKALMDKIKSINVDATKLDNAVKGNEVQQAIKDYIEKVKQYCAAVVSDINAFADKLYEVSRVWEESQKTFATGSINESANSSFSGSTTEEYRTKEASASVSGN